MLFLPLPVPTAYSLTLPSDFQLDSTLFSKSYSLLQFCSPFSFSLPLAPPKWSKPLPHFPCLSPPTIAIPSSAFTPGKLLLCPSSACKRAFTAEKQSPKSAVRSLATKAAHCHNSKGVGWEALSIAWFLLPLRSGRDYKEFNHRQAADVTNCCPEKQTLYLQVTWNLNNRGCFRPILHYSINRLDAISHLSCRLLLQKPQNCFMAFDIQ